MSHGRLIKRTDEDGLDELITKLRLEGRDVVLIRAESTIQEWTPFEHAGAIQDTDETYSNSIFQVFVYENSEELPIGFDCEEAWPRMVHLSIKTHDRNPIHDWRLLQRIKNELCGTHCEAVELYPMNIRLHDSANQFHLWCMEPFVPFPFGYIGRVCDDNEIGIAQMKAFEKSLPIKLQGKRKQRPFQKYHLADDLPMVGPVWLSRGYKNEEPNYPDIG